jgi:hypothetical protein
MILSMQNVDCSIQSLLKILKIEIPNDLEPYDRMSKLMKMKPCDLQRTIPDFKFRSWKHKIDLLIQDNLTFEDLEYAKTLKKILIFLNEIKPSLVSKDSIENDRFQSLKPDENGYHQPIIYSNTKTATGRLTVTSGPNVLTMPSSFKNNLRSRFDGGKILQIDLIAAEPTVALNLVNNPPIEDPYQDISRLIFQNEVARDVCKNIVLCSLYGQSKKNLSKKIPSHLSVDDAIRKTKDYFDYESLLERIERTTFRTDWIRNHYGRPIRMQERNESLLVSYFLQSTAAEAALLAFSNLHSRTKDHSVPICLIHDAMLIDCKPDYHSFLLSKKILKLKVNDWIFPAKVTVVNE